MNKTINILAVLLLTLNLNYAYADLLSGRVVGVSDGDTITILDNTNTQYKIRLAGIDAPEKKQAFGNVSKQSLSDLVYGKQVDIDWQKQVKRGLAWYYKKYQNELVLEDRLDYLHAEESAEKSRVGLWIDKEPIAPWDFRKSRRSN